MTKEKLVELMNSSEYKQIAATRIMQALDSEKMGEVVLGEGKVDWFANTFGGGTYIIGDKHHPLEKINGKKGQLIFKEDK